MTVEELLFFGKREIHSDHAKLLLALLLDLNPLELLNHLEDFVAKEKCDLYYKEISAMKCGKPLQYIIGNVNFYGNKFIVNENVLIPRFETEELVEKTIYYINKYFHENVSILDIGCGSGVIGLTLAKKLSTVSVDLVDISNAAVEISKINSKNLEVLANIYQSDLFSNVEGKYDVIISNPPYIKENEEIDEIVKENEPSIALYGGLDGLDYYRRILKDVRNYMKKRCLIAFEIGESQKEDIFKLISEFLEDVEVECLKDLSGRDRMIFIFKDLKN